MTAERRALVEFLAVVALTLALVAALVVLAVAGVQDDSAVTRALVDALKVLLGVVGALAYAARGLVQRGRRNGGDDGQG